MDISQSEYDAEPDYEFVNSIAGQYSKAFNVPIPRAWLECKDNDILVKHQGVNLFKKTFLFNVKLQKPDNPNNLSCEYKITLHENRKVAIAGITVRKYIAHGKEPIRLNIYPNRSIQKDYTIPGNVFVKGIAPTYTMLADGFQFEGNDVIFKVSTNSSLLLDFPDLSVDTYKKGCDRLDTSEGVYYYLSTELRPEDGIFKHPIPFVYDQIAKKKNVKMTENDGKKVYRITENEYNQILNGVAAIVNDARMDVDDIVVKFDIDEHTPNAGGMVQLDIYYSWVFDTPKPAHGVRS